MDLKNYHRNRIFEKGKIYVDILSSIQSKDEYVVLSIGSGVGIVPVTDEGKFLLVKEFRIGAAEEQWNWPSGGLEEDEKLEECAIRELREETGHTAEKLIYLGEFNSAPSHLEGKLHYFYSRTVTKVQEVSDEPLILTSDYFTKDEVLSMIWDGRIKHTGTITAFFLTLTLLKTNANL